MAIFFMGYNKRLLSISPYVSATIQEHYFGWTWACLERDIPLFILED